MQVSKSKSIGITQIPSVPNVYNLLLLNHDGIAMPLCLALIHNARSQKQKHNTDKQYASLHFNENTAFFRLNH
jgi:hypothetical protein